MTEQVPKVNIETELSFNNKSKTKDALFNELGPYLSQVIDQGDNAETIVMALKEREAVGTTGFGDGFAIPHGKINTILEPYLFYIRLKNPVHWEAMDKEDVSHLFVLLVSDKNPFEQLKILSILSYILLDDSLQQVIKEEKDSAVVTKTLLSIFSKEDSN